MTGLAQLLQRMSPRVRGIVAVVLVLAAGGVLGFRAWRAGQAPRVTAALVVPCVLALMTSSDAEVSDGDLVPTGTPLRLTFNTTMNAGSVRLLANQVLLGLSWMADGRSAALDVGSLRIGPVELAIAPGGRDTAGHPLVAWRLGLATIFGVQAHTVPLAAPALVQVPNDPGARDQTGLQSAAIVYE
jgi:hypothetical protein